MKKFVMVDYIGKWEQVQGQVIIHCEVKQVAIVAEANKPEELACPLNIQYHDDGSWHSYSIVPRAKAKRNLGL